MKKYAIVRSLDLHNNESKHLYSYERTIELISYDNALKLIYPILIETEYPKRIEKIGKYEPSMTLAEPEDLFEAEDDEAAKLIFEVWE